MAGPAGKTGATGPNPRAAALTNGRSRWSRPAGASTVHDSRVTQHATAQVHPAPQGSAIKPPPAAPSRFGTMYPGGNTSGVIPSAPKPPAGGVDLPRFASEVSGNFAKGVAAAGQGIGDTAAAIGRGVGAVQGFIAGGGITGPNGVKGAMDTGLDKSNPLHRILGGG